MLMPPSAPAEQMSCDQVSFRVIHVLVATGQPALDNTVIRLLDAVNSPRYSPKVAHTLSEVESKFSESHFDVVLISQLLFELATDAGLLPQFSARSAMIVLTENDNPDVGVELIECGAQEFIPVSALSAGMLSRVIRYSHQRHLSARRIDGLIQDSRQAETARQRFLANMNHELRTPLTTILGFTELLIDEAVEGFTRDCLSTVRSSGRHLLGLVDRILSLTSLESGNLPLEPQPFSPAAVVLSICNSLESQVLNNGIWVKWQVSEDIPSIVEADYNCVRQILSNIIGNAVAFTTQGGVTIHTEWVFESGTQGRLVFNVSDTGPGISREMQEQLFIPLSCCEQRDRSLGIRTGVGLPLARGYAEAAGGLLDLQSIPGHGTTVTVTLPVRIPDSVDSNGVRNELHTHLTCPRRSGLVGNHPQEQPSLRGRILIAEDNTDNQTLLRTVLERRGLSVVCVGNGREACDVLLNGSNESDFDLVLMDMQMPEVDGFSATAELRASGYSRPIIALTANSQSSERRRCLDAGCTNHVAKPIEWDTLWKAMQRHLDHAIQPATLDRLTGQTSARQDR